MNIICTGCTQIISTLVTKSKHTIKVPSRWQRGFLFYKVKHLIAWCATLHVCYMGEQEEKSILLCCSGPWASRPLCQRRLLQEVQVLQTSLCPRVPANTVPRFKKSLGACSVATAGKENQGSHFNCICLLVINLLVQKDRWGKWCINTNLAGLRWNY